MDQKTITYVGGGDMIFPQTILTHLAATVVINIASIAELFVSLATAPILSNLIVIDMEELFTRPEVDLYDIIQTLSTLTNYHLQQVSNTTQISTINIAVATSNTPNMDHLRSVVETKELGVYPCGDASDDDKETALAALLEGEAYIPPNIKKLLKPPKSKSKNTVELTPRQQQILNLLTHRGASNKVLAKMLHISESTVKLHVSAILKKYGAHSRTQLVLFAKDRQ